jgi:hypothetical protein
MEGENWKNERKRGQSAGRKMVELGDERIELLEGEG